MGGVPDRISQWKDGERLRTVDTDGWRAEGAVRGREDHPECLQEVQGNHVTTRFIQPTNRPTVWSFVHQPTNGLVFCPSNQPTNGLVLCLSNQPTNDLFFCLSNQLTKQATDGLICC